MIDNVTASTSSRSPSQSTQHITTANKENSMVARTGVFKLTWFNCSLPTLFLIAVLPVLSCTLGNSKVPIEHINVESEPALLRFGSLTEAVEKKALEVEVIGALSKNRQVDIFVMLDVPGTRLQLRPLAPSPKQFDELKSVLTKHKSQLLETIPSFELLRDYDAMPMLLIRVLSEHTLLAVLNNPLVSAIAINKALSSNSKCNTSGRDRLRCCHEPMLHAHEHRRT
jgi:hypothetical protein